MKTTTYKQTKIGLIPEDWEILNIGELTSKILGGGTPSRNIKEYWNGNIPWMTVKDFSTFNPYQTQEYITDIGLQNSSTRLVKSNDLIIATRIALGQIVKYNVDVTINQDLKTLQLNSNVDKDYFIYSFRNLSNKIIEKGSGSTVLGLSIDDLKSFQIPLPPLTEQIAIAEALSDADAWIESLEQMIAKKRVLKQGAMQTLLTPAADWEVKKLGEICEFKNGTAHENVVDENGEYIIVNSKFISQEGNVRKYSNAFLCPLYKDEIVMVMSDIPNGKALAKCYIIEENNKYTLNQRICAFYPKQNFDSMFLYYKINRNEYFLSFDSGSGQTNLRKDEVLNCPIDFPNYQEQTRIATILSDMDTELEALEAQLEKAKQIKQGMMQELLTGRVRLV